MPQYTMLIKRKASQGGASEDDEDDELESEDEFFNWFDKLTSNLKQKN